MPKERRAKSREIIIIDLLEKEMHQIIDNDSHAGAAEFCRQLELVK